MELLNVEDNGVHLEINKRHSNRFTVRLSVTYKFVIAYQRTWMELYFEEAEFRCFVESVVNGIPSKHGVCNLLRSKQVIVKKPLAAVSYRELKLLDRVFIIGFRYVPATLSNKIVGALSGIVV